nr:reverse transcriptase domain-containing protein [Tanacetum cinerariifolium]
ITTQSGIAFKGTTIPTNSFPPKVVERETEVTKDTVPPTNNGSTKDVQPPSVLTNKEKLFELAKTPLNKHCSAVLLKKLPEKLGDPDKYLIPCDFLGMDECLALANLGASINLMPLSIWNKLSLPELFPTCMTLELADRSISCPVGVVKDVFIKLGKFHFPADFVVVDFDADPRVLLILEGSFLKTGRALIDVYEGELTLRVGDKAVTFNLDQTLRYFANYDAESINRIDVIDVVCEEYSQEVLGFFVSGNPTSYTEPIVSTFSPTLTSFGDSDFLLMGTDAFLAIEDEPISLEIDGSYYDWEGDILLLEEFLNDGPSLPTLPLQELKVVEPKNENSSIDELPVVELKDLPPHLKYAVLEGYFQIPIDHQDQEKTTFTCPYRTFAYRHMPFGLGNAAGTFQRCMMDIFHDMIKKTMEVFMDDFSVFGNSFRTCLSHLDKMLKWCEDINICLNWKKSHFMFKEDIVLDHKISNNEIEDAKPRLLWWVLLLQELDIIIRDKKGAKNLAADHLSRLENPHQSVLDKKEINEMFPLETLNMVMLKYDVTHRLATAYHAQTSGQMEVSNHGLKRILERTVGENHASWSDKLDDTLWAFRTAFKTPIGCTPYKLVYRKACDHQKVQLNELNELRDQAYENSLIYKEKTKRIHDSKIKDRIFNAGDRVLFNSRLNIFSGKLKTRWTGPFTVTQVFSYGTVELSQTDGPNLKLNGHRLKHYFGGDIPPMMVPDLQTFPKDQYIWG